MKKKDNRDSSKNRDKQPQPKKERYRDKKHTNHVRLTGKLSPEDLEDLEYEDFQ